MKKTVLHQLSSSLSTRSRLFLLILGLSLVFIHPMSSQSYTYEMEGFESDVWATASSSRNAIKASTGTWNVARNNVQSTALTAYEGTYSFFIQNKGDALIFPKLENGCGTLTYYVTRSSNRTIYVHVSKDSINWSDAIDTFVATAEWVKRTVEINDPTIKYVKFQSNSNGGLHIDNVLITSPGVAGVKVTTTEPTNITQSSALVGGIITNENNDPISGRGVCYGTAAHVDINSDKITIDEELAEFSATLNDLLPGTTYYVKAYAITATGVNYGEELVFSTRSSDPPIAYFLQDFNDDSHMPSSEPATPVSIVVPGQGTWIYLKSNKSTNASYIQDGSVSNLRLKKDGAYVITPILEDGITELSFYEGRGGRSLTVYTSTDEGSTWTLLETVTTVKVVPNIVSVNSAEVNRIKIANESGGDADIDNLSITVYPTGVIPGVTTGEVTNVHRNTASITGVVTDNGSKEVLERGIVWSLEATPILLDNKVYQNEGVGSFSLSLTGLPAGKTIYLRAFATSRSGTGYGEVISFTTLPAIIPEITTVEATQVTSETALAGGTIQDFGGASILSQGVCWGLHNTPTVGDSKTNDLNKEDAFESLLTDLTPNTTYYYRAYAENEAGVGYGEVLSFKTGALSMPSITTASISELFSYKAIGGGIITNTGNAPVTYGLCWNTTGTPSISDTRTIIEDGETEFSSIIGNLRASTTYYVRAYVTNTMGTAYGEVVPFTTSPATILYVSPSGNDTDADGSSGKPFYSLQNAIDLVQAGDTIYMLAGTYNYSARINVGSVGDTDGGMIAVIAKDGRALLDFSSMPVDGNLQGIRITGSYWYFYGLDIKGAGDNGMLIERNKPTGGTPADIINRTHEGHSNVIEFCSFFENADTGLQMKNMAENNRIINCDSYYNCDPEHGNADGFAPKLSVGTGNYFYGCRAWNNSDDGWDGILYDAGEGFADDMTTIYENCWAFRNGFLKDGKESKGNGNGFKLGGSGNMDRRHNGVLIRCLAFDNLMKGFDQNHNTGSMTLINCTGHSNKYLANKNHFTYKIDEDILAEGKELTLINCVAVWDGITDPGQSQYTPLRLMQGIRHTCDFQTGTADYVSLDTIGVTLPRKADGSLPDLDFMKIKPGNTKLIDKGTIVDEVSYFGEAPDLGCFETGAPTSIEDITDEKVDPKQQALIYPQPVDTEFTVNLPNSLSQTRFFLQIYDLDGRPVYSQHFFGNSVIIDRNKLEAGLYVALFTDEGTGTKYSSKLTLK